MKRFTCRSVHSRAKQDLPVWKTREQEAISSALCDFAEGRLVLYVFVLHPEAKLPRILRGSHLGVGVARVAGKAMANLHRWHTVGTLGSPCLLALFVKHCADQGGIDTIRLQLSGGHPYGKQLWKLRFIAREDAAVFQLYGPKAQARLGESKWFLTYGDKDI
jgi:hypothetical protein